MRWGAVWERRVTEHNGIYHGKLPPITFWPCPIHLESKSTSMDPETSQPQPLLWPTVSDFRTHWDLKGMYDSIPICGQIRTAEMSLIAISYELFNVKLNDERPLCLLQSNANSSRFEERCQGLMKPIDSRDARCPRANNKIRKQMRSHEPSLHLSICRWSGLLLIESAYYYHMENASPFNLPIQRCVQ